MRFLATADIQADWSNLDQCSMALLEIIDICHRKNLDTVIFCGDLKNTYNPIDGRVIKWWMQAIRQLRKEKLKILAYLGNHDRFGLYTDAQNWLDILADAGAIVYDRPAVVGDKNRLFILPYTSSVKRFQKSADEFLDYKPNKETDILLFHQNLKGSRFNLLGQVSDSKIKPRYLHPDKYLYCIGGDIHLPQIIGKNIYYTGSPFAMDWGEVNQSKSYIIVRGIKLNRIASKIPGLFDPRLKNFPRHRDWKGCGIRVYFDARVGKDYIKEMDDAKVAAERKYPGAYIYTVPDYGKDTSDQDTLIDVSETDAKKIRLYVKAVNKEYSTENKRIGAYLIHRIEQAGGLGKREGTSVEFIKSISRNMGSFKTLKLDYTMGGIVVINGINADWKGRSNGSGKTTSIQSIPIAAFGKTFKGQAHDNWARRGTDEEAFIKLWLKNARGQKIRIHRSRRPSLLEMSVNGKDESSGNRANAKDGTQGQIEKVLGFTWQTLANAVYIDESVTKAFLSGTRKERTELLNRFQNLERFEQALKLVRVDRGNHQKIVERTKSFLYTLEARVDDCRHTLKKAKKERRDEFKRIRSSARIAFKRFRKAKQKFEAFRAKADKKRKEISDKMARLEKRASNYIRKHGTISGRIAESNRRISRLEDAHGCQKCPTCYQSVDKKLINRLLRKWKKRLSQHSTLAEKIHSKHVYWLNKVANEESEYDHLGIRISERHDKVMALESRYKLLVEQLDNFPKSSDSKTIRHHEMKYQSLRFQYRKMKESLSALRKETWFYEFCEVAMSREGIPAFLNAQLIPILNKSAKLYAEKFADSEIQVRFEIIDGEWEPRILNAHGGETIGDQSKGERALAGLITSFALRECAPKSNVLFLDEVADGLDEANATKFAEALRELKSKFGTIFLTTFNPHILSVLGEEKTITIVKKNGISSVVDKRLLHDAVNQVSAGETYKEE